MNWWFGMWCFSIFNALLACYLIVRCHLKLGKAFIASAQFLFVICLLFRSRCLLWRHPMRQRGARCVTLSLLGSLLHWCSPCSCSLVFWWLGTRPWWGLVGREWVQRSMKLEHWAWTWWVASFYAPLWQWGFGGPGRRRIHAMWCGMQLRYPPFALSLLCLRCRNILGICANFSYAVVAYW